MKNKKKIIIIIVSTIALAILTVFSAIKLYQMRQERIAPTKPSAVTEQCTLEVHIPPEPSLTPTSSPTPPPGSPTPSLTLTLTPEPSPTPVPTVQPGEPTLTPVPTVQPGEPTLTPVPTEPLVTIEEVGNPLPTIGMILGGIILGVASLLFAL